MHFKCPILIFKLQVTGKYLYMTITGVLLPPIRVVLLKHLYINSKNIFLLIFNFRSVKMAPCQIQCTCKHSNMAKIGWSNLFFQKKKHKGMIQD